MNIRHTMPSDIDAVMEIYALARAFMRRTGNLDQWNNNYPAREIIEADIEKKSAYVLEENGEIIACFFFQIGIDPTYIKIYDGKWINDDEYGVIHRIAVKYNGRNIIGKVYEYCSKLCKNLKIDTHKDNKPMQRSLEKNGFTRCGIIYLENGDERIAYQRCI